MSDIEFTLTVTHSRPLDQETLQGIRDYIAWLTTTSRKEMKRQIKEASIKRVRAAHGDAYDDAFAEDSTSDNGRSGSDSDSDRSMKEWSPNAMEKIMGPLSPIASSSAAKTITPPQPSTRTLRPRFLTTKKRASPLRSPSGVQKASRASISPFSASQPAGFFTRYKKKWGEWHGIKA